MGGVKDPFSPSGPSGLTHYTYRAPPKLCTYDEKRGGAPTVRHAAGGLGAWAMPGPGPPGGILVRGVCGKAILYATTGHRAPCPTAVRGVPGQEEVAWALIIIAHEWAAEGGGERQSGTAGPGSAAARGIRDTSVRGARVACSSSSVRQPGSLTLEAVLTEGSARGSRQRPFSDVVWFGIGRSGPPCDADDAVAEACDDAWCPPLCCVPCSPSSSAAHLFGVTCFLDRGHFARMCG